MHLGEKENATAETEATMVKLGNGREAMEMDRMTSNNKPRQRRRTSIINEPKEPPITEQ